MVEIRKLEGALGAEVLGLDLRSPLSENDLLALARAIGEHGVLVFRNQEVAPHEEAGWHDRFRRLSATVRCSSERAPTGVSTFASTTLALAALPTQTVEKLAELSAVHRVDGQGDVRLPIVRHHEVTGKRYLFVSPLITQWIDDMEPRHSTEMVDMLWRHISDPRFSYVHRWLPGDFLVWDSDCVRARNEEAILS